MVSGEFVLGYFIKIHIFSHVDDNNIKTALCGLHMHAARNLTEKEQRKLENASSKYQAGYCLKCLDEKRRLKVRNN